MCGSAYNFPSNGSSTSRTQRPVNRTWGEFVLVPLPLSATGSWPGACRGWSHRLHRGLQGATAQVQLPKLVLPFPATKWNTAKRRQCGVNATRLPGFLSSPAVVFSARSGGAS